MSGNGGDITLLERLTRRAWLAGSAAIGLFGALWWMQDDGAHAGPFEMVRTDEEWRRLLNAPAYYVLRQHGTERPYSSPLNGEKRAGIFHCAGCDLPLFASQTKYESGTGWPSFYQPLPDAVRTRSDRSLLMVRTEVHCRRCGGHLGHVFEDGPKPTGLRYCMNGVAMKFRPAEAA
jgi:peptide-methionine (R)-S-oxide reductase